MADADPDFVNPGVAFRGKPFWSWNGKLNEAELLRQIRLLKEMGFGGFFMHSRTGLATEYLGDEWFRLTNACADEAEKLGLEAWLYDEDRWPSGTAGGLVTQDPAHRQKFISLYFVEPRDFTWDDGVIAAFSAQVDELTFSNCRRLKANQTPTAGTVLVFRIESPLPSSFYNGYTYVDTLSRPAIDRYLQLTHEQYLARCDGRLGKIIKGIFTDEPHRGPVMCGFSITNPNRLWMTPYTDLLFDEFKKAFGYDLIDRLPELFLQLNGQPVSPVKWQYMELLQRLFLQNFAAPMHSWCKQHKLQLTGHVLHEDSLSAQSAMQGSLMRFYEHMDMPGIDLLGESTRCYWVAKQLSSAARQLGKQWLLSELYGCTGWQMTFENHKAVGDWQALFGINVRCQHLSWYTMEGEAKRDYPASISYQSAWYKEYRHVEDYYGRLHVFLGDGNPCCDVLVINPVESVWCQIHGGWAKSLSPIDEPVKKLESHYADLFHWLAGAQLDFDYGDEEMMSRLATAGSDAKGAVVEFGKARYRVVVVGDMTTIRSSTLALLERFVDAGGTVVFAGDAPRYVDALASSAAIELSRRASAVALDRAAVAAAVGSASGEPRGTVSAADGTPLPGVFCQLKRVDDQHYRLVAINTDPDHELTDVRVRLCSFGSVAEWDCETGERYATRSRSIDENTIEFTTDFAPSGLRAFVVGDGADRVLSHRPQFIEHHRHAVAGPYHFELTEPNVCVLDYAEYQIGDEVWKPAEEVLKVDRAVRSAFGLPWRSGEMVQPWFRDRLGSEPATKGTVRLRFSFNVAAIPMEPIELGIERPERFRVRLNNRPIDTAADCGWWVDKSIRKLPIPANMLRSGGNQLELEVSFDEGINLEAIYLLGKFGVTVAGPRATIGVLPQTLATTDIALQGLPFYGGGIRYRLPIVHAALAPGRMLLELPELSAACVNVFAAEQPPMTLAWRPFKLDVTDIAADATELIVELLLTRRNTFGPLHQWPARSASYGPDNFLTTGERWRDDYVLLPAGLLASPVLIDAVLGDLPQQSR